MLSYFSMTRNCYLLMALFLFTVACSHSSSKKDRLTLSWEENFEGTNHFDTTIWSKVPRGSADWHDTMSDYDSLYAIDDGKLILRGIKNTKFPNDTSKYLTGGLWTKGKKRFGLGRLEIRAKLEAATGAWPAFWLLAAAPGVVEYPHGGEIDIMERLNDDAKVYQTVHSYYTIDLGLGDKPSKSSTAPINPSEYNTYAVETYQDSVVFFVNGQQNFAYPRIKTDKKGQFPFSEYKHYLILSMQLGGSWVGKVDPKDLPVEMKIDWIKFYKRTN